MRTIEIWLKGVALVVLISGWCSIVFSFCGERRNTPMFSDKAGVSDTPDATAGLPSSDLSLNALPDKPAVAPSRDVWETAE